MKSETNQNDNLEEIIEDTMELHQEVLDKVAGGVFSEIRLNTIEEIESSPIFEKLKEKLAYYTHRIDVYDEAYKTRVENELGLVARKNGYFFNRALGQEFIRKYKDLV